VFHRTSIKSYRLRSLIKCADARDPVQSTWADFETCHMFWEFCWKLLIPYIFTHKSPSPHMEFGRNVMEDKVIPVQAWTDPEGSRRLRLPNSKTFSTIKVVRF
jgi:hypothetical protein